MRWDFLEVGPRFWLAVLFEFLLTFLNFVVFTQIFGAETVFNFSLKIGSGFCIVILLIVILISCRDHKWINSKTFIDVFIRLLMFEALILGVMAGLMNSNTILIVSAIGLFLLNTSCSISYYWNLRAWDFRLKWPPD